MSNIFAMADTWNNGATVFTAIKMNVTDTASDAASLLMDLQVAASSKFSVSKAGAAIAASLALGGATIGTDALGITGTATISGALTLGTSGILIGGTNTINQRNGATGQTFNIFNTYTDASNNEALSITWSSNLAELVTTHVGTGSARSLGLGTDGSVFWRISTGGSFLGQNDNSNDIGAQATTRPRSVYVGTGVSIGGGALTATMLSLPAGTTAKAQINFAASTAPTSPVDGDWWFDGTNLKIRISGSTKTVTAV